MVSQKKSHFGQKTVRMRTTFFTIVLILGDLLNLSVFHDEYLCDDPG